MYLNLDLLYNISDHFQDIFYYSLDDKNLVYNKKTQKMIECYKWSNQIDFLWTDLLNKTICFNFGSFIYGEIAKYEISNQIIKICDNCFIRTQKKIKLSIADNDFLCNDIRLDKGPFRYYENKLKI